MKTKNLYNLRASAITVEVFFRLLIWTVIYFYEQNAGNYIKTHAANDFYFCCFLYISFPAVLFFAFKAFGDSDLIRDMRELYCYDVLTQIIFLW